MSEQVPDNLFKVLASNLKTMLLGYHLSPGQAETLKNIILPKVRE